MISGASPITGNDELDVFLYNLSINDDDNTGVTVDSISGKVYDKVTGLVVSYLYRYIHVKYADDNIGTNMSDIATGKLYFGVRNVDTISVESTNPADYTWYKSSSAFSSTNKLYYQTSGGRQIRWLIASSAPDDTWVLENINAIDLDKVSYGKQAYAASIYRWTTDSNPPGRPTTTTNFTWATKTYTAPPGWATTAPSQSTGETHLWMITINLNESVNAIVSVLDWTSTSYPIILLVQNGDDGLSALTAYLIQDQATTAPVISPNTTTGMTVPAGWSTTVGLPAVGQVVWYSFGLYNGTSGTVDGIPAGKTLWAEPTAASVFQDIRSDNWNGSSPPIFATPATWGTAGYYIRRSDGTMIANNFAARGTLVAGTATSSSGIGAYLGADGAFRLGGSTGNISHVAGSDTIEINGNLVATGNLNLNAATYVVGSAASGGTASITAYLDHNADVYLTGTAVHPTGVQADLKIDGASTRGVLAQGSIAMVFKASLAAGSHTFSMESLGTNSSVVVLISYR